MKPMSKSSKLALIALAIVGLAGAAYATIRSSGGPEEDRCCATEFDASPYQQVPTRTLP